MTFPACTGKFGRPLRGARPHLRYALVLTSSALFLGCQKEDNHAPFAPGCSSDCQPSPGIAIGSAPASAPPVTTPPDGGFSAGTLSGNVLQLIDDSFTQAVQFSLPATVSADGPNGATVSAAWNGTDPFALSGVNVAATNWVSVSPNNIQGDTLPTWQAVQTNATSTADLAVVNSAALDTVLTAVSAVRSPLLGHVVLFFRNAGTSAALSGVRAVLAAAEAPAYAAASGWVRQDDTTTTNASGLVVFGNVELPSVVGSLQTVSVSRPATATSPAISGGQFSVKVVAGSVTLASIVVRL